MNIVDFVLVGYITAGAAGYLLMARPATAVARARRWGSRRGLPTTDDVLAQVARQRAGRARAIGTGSLLGTWPTFVVLALLEPVPPPVPRAIVVVVSFAVGACVAIALYGFVRSRHIPAGAVRVAHAAAPDRRAFARPAFLFCLRLTLVVGLVAALVATTALGSTGSGVAAAALVVGWAAAELAVARLIDAPQRFSRPEDLMVDDAVRGERVRDLYSLPLVLAAVAATVAYTATGPVGRQVSGSLEAGLAGAAGLVAVSGLAMTVWVLFAGRTSRAATV